MINIRDIKMTALRAKLLFLLPLLVACTGNPASPQDDMEVKHTVDTIAIYRGNLFVSGYDSIVNVLTLQSNETFTLSQVDRIAEHHLNERSHEGLFSTLNDSTQLGLFTKDGTLMLRFKMIQDDLTPVDLNGLSVLDQDNIWKRQRAISK